MKCQKCARPAMVHLTEIMTKQDAGDAKRAVEIHLCLAHAVEAGLLTPGTESKSATPAASHAPIAGASAMVPAKPKSVVIAPAAERVPPSDAPTCPACGMTWTQFKSGGVMGCTHDYEFFAMRLLPLVKRAHEGGIEHVGKVPRRRRVAETDRRRVADRAKRELQRAVDAENYELAAQLRDQLKQLELAGTSAGPESRQSDP